VRAQAPAPASTGADDSSSHRGHRTPGRRAFRLVLVSLLLACAAVVVARPFVVESFRIASESMAPSLQAGDRVLVDTLSYDLEDVRRGDVVAFEDPDSPGHVMIKRAVALPHDTIAIRAGSLMVNGVHQREAYLGFRSTGSDFYGPTIVPSGHLFVLGDNRPHSVDSRFSGPVPGHDLLGRVFARVWPPGRMEML
jgi:signal peptidase I